MNASTATDRPLRSRTVGDIATSLPGATAVFRRFNLDFCCGGDVSLDAAAERKGISVATVEAALAAVDAALPLAPPADTRSLIDHIQTRYHAAHRRELAELERLAGKVEAVHKDHPEAPQGLSSLLTQMTGDLEVHMKKEELVLFPALLHPSTPLARQAVATMRHEHLAHADFIRRLEKLTGGFVPPADGCRSWQALYRGLAKFVDDLMEHLSLENNLLFPRFE